MVNNLTNDNKVLKENLEDYKAALAFLIQRHKEVQTDNWKNTELRIENNSLENKLQTYKIYGISGFNEEGPNGILNFCLNVIFRPKFS